MSTSLGRPASLAVPPFAATLRARSVVVHDLVVSAPPGSRLAAYQASKFAVWGLAETLRLELAADGIGVSVIFPSAMISRHLETSEAAQPEHLRRAVAADDDFAAMFASNPDMAAALATPEAAATRVVDALLADEPFIVTHGDLVDAVESRAAQLRRAAAAAR